MNLENIEQIVYSIAELHGKNTDEGFINVITEMVYTWASKLKRQHLQKNGNKSIFESSITLPLETSTLADVCNLPLCSVLKTTTIVPDTILLDDTPLRVSTPDKKTWITFVTPDSIENSKYRKWTSKTIKYTMINGYIYIINNLLLENISIVGIWDRPDKLEDYECSNCKASNHYLPGSMAADIRRAILDELRLKVQGINGEIDEISNIG